MQKSVKILMIYLFILCFSVNWISAQYDNINASELKASATKDFEQEKYSVALEKFNALIARYPKDGLFQYYAGICMYKTNRSLPVAVQSLKYASGKPNTPDDVWYHLGEAYMKNYQFPEARKAFIHYNEIATKTDAREKIPMRKATMAENAIDISRQYNTVEIIASSLFDFSDTVFIRRIKAPGGVLDFKPVGLGSAPEEGDEFNGLCFIPRNLEKGDYLYFSGYGKSRKRGSEIYRVKMQGSKRYAEPELIETLNSDYNEILPYYDPIGEDLYFASEGHSSMGGFDVFKTHYKKEDGSWTEPINLGFPVNSPSNEFIFIPGPDLGEIILVTDRQGLDTMLTVYLIRIKEPKQLSSGSDNENLRKIGMFGGIESIPDIVDIGSTGLPSGDQTVKVSRQGPVPVTAKDVNYSDEYSGLVKEALGFQYKADSLARASREARQKVKSIPDPDQRWSMQSSIILWEKQSDEYQKKANECYAQLKKMENTLAKNDSIPAPIKKDTVINAITTYRFNTSQPAAKDNTIAASTATASDSPTGNKPVPEQKANVVLITKTAKINEFVVLEKSPYSAAKPIPVDIKIPPGSFYRIQLGVFSQKQDVNAFGGMSPLSAETIPGKPLTRYYAGMFAEYESAKSALNIVRSRGYKDAFIVAWYDGQKLPPEKVLELEKRDAK